MMRMAAVALVALVATQCAFYRSFDPTSLPRGEGIEYLRPPLALGEGALDFGISEGMSWPEVQSAMGGEITLFVRWSPECPVSGDVLPHLAALMPFHGHRGLRVVALASADSDPAEATRHLRIHEIDLPLFFEQTRCEEMFPSEMTPSAALVDSSGQVFARYTWSSSERPTADEIEVAVVRLLRGLPWRP